MASLPVEEYGPDSGGRLKGVTIVKPIVVGTVAKYFGKTRDGDGHTHQWTVHVKPYLNEDYSAFIKKVHFKLHDSYPNPNRVVTKPPYEVVETGWGEFEIIIKIHFNDPVERPVTIPHVLKLFPPTRDPGPSVPSKKPVIAEFYDEIVFQDPTVFMKSLIDNIKPLPDNEFKPDPNIEAWEKNSFDVMSTARGIIKTEIQDLKEKLKLARETIEKFKDALANAQTNSDKQ